MEVDTDRITMILRLFITVMDRSEPLFGSLSLSFFFFWLPPFPTLNYEPSDIRIH